MKGDMTLRQIAELCEVDPTTVGRWAEKASCEMQEISCKTQEARETSKPARFTLPETLAIIRAGGRNTLADLLAQNAKERELPRVKGITASFLDALRKLYGPSEAARWLDYLIGYKNLFNSRPAIEGPEKASLEAGEKAFGKLHLIAERGPVQPDLEVAP